MMIQLDADRALNVVQSGEGQSVVLLHGNGEDQSIFQELRSSLENSFRIIAIDSPGHGKSYNPPLMDYPLMAQDIAEVIKQVTDDKPLIVGFSDGGIIALHMAIADPDLAAGLVLCGVNLTLDGVADELVEAMKRAYENGEANDYTKLMLMQEDIPLDHLRKINIPVLVTAGEHDLIKSEHSGLIAAALPKATLRIFAGEDHGSYIDHSNYLAPIITEFRTLIEVDENRFKESDL